jgi:hypothetical protein
MLYAGALTTEADHFAHTPDRHTAAHFDRAGAARFALLSFAMRAGFDFSSQAEVL